jgi:hypothetical protein
VSRAARVELQLTLNFACAACGGAVAATLHCEGPRDALQAARPAIRLACPHCGRANQLSFDNRGRVWGVAPVNRHSGPPGPSWN